MYGEDGNWYAVFANGLNSTNQNPALFIVNLSTGVVTRKIVVDDGGDYTNGLVRIALADVNGNGRVDAVYGGDYRGNLWKFDLGSPDPGGWISWIFCPSTRAFGDHGAPSSPVVRAAQEVT